MQQGPKHIIKNFRNRNHAFGRERRLNMDKTVLENNPHFPNTLGYEDIDREVFNWVDKGFDITFDGKRFNTYKLFSNQRITEYGQTWQNLDEKGNLDINFKTITRESNPQKGDMQGGNYNIPGNITFPIFRVKALDENGVEYTEMYSMKQPTSINLIYTIGIFTNAYKLLNKMNTEIHKEFKSLEKYIFPNGFSIPMELNSVSDESEYTIDDRKYYCQTYQIKVLGYIITNDDYVVTKVPSRLKTQFVSGRNSKLRNKKKIFNIQSLEINNQNTTLKEFDNCDSNVKIESIKDKLSVDEVMNTPIREEEIEIEELCGLQPCWENTEDEFYVNRKIIINISPSYCNKRLSFISEYHLGVETLQLKNIKNYKLLINDIEIKVEDSDVEILKDDTITIETTLNNEKEIAQLTLICYDLDSIIENDVNNDPETINV